MTKLRLTNRQKQVLCLATRTNKKIANILNISPRTVRNHFTDIYKALDLTHIPPISRSRRIVAINTALDHNIIVIEDVSTGDRPTTIIRTETAS